MMAFFNVISSLEAQSGTDWNHADKVLSSAKSYLKEKHIC